MKDPYDTVQNIVDTALEISNDGDADATVNEIVEGVMEDYYGTSESD